MVAPLVHLLDADPDLGQDLDPDALPAARAAVVAKSAQISRGPWTLPAPSGRELGAHLGVLVLEGVLVREQRLGKVESAELLGGGDVLRPWIRGDELSSVPSPPTWTVLQPAVLAILDRRFTTVAGQWPEVIGALFERSIQRTRMLAFQMAISHVRRVDLRLQLLFWRLADQWGRVNPHGVTVPVRLTHVWLARLVGAQRPSVTTALRSLSEKNLVTRDADGSWLLHGDPPKLDEDALGQSAALTTIP
jgi:CRP/FNR family transcriptional regulator, cyclic AMP receptor protein